MINLTVDHLKKLLHYDPATGIFTRRIQVSSNAKAGDTPRCRSDGYLRIRIDGKQYKSHRLAWLYMTGAWPKDQVDHINGIRDDNRFGNLREATHTENCQNIAVPAHNTSGFIGVHWHRRRQRWVARIYTARHYKYLGQFINLEDAHAAYLAAKAKYHPFQPTPRDIITLEVV